jgi:hypothetical protein
MILNDVVDGILLRFILWLLMFSCIHQHKPTLWCYYSVHKVNMWCKTTPQEVLEAMGTCTGQRYGAMRDPKWGCLSRFRALKCTCHTPMHIHNKAIN